MPEIAVPPRPAHAELEPPTRMTRDRQDDPSVAGAPRGEIVALLLADGVVSEPQVRHAERVRERLSEPRPLVPLLLELGLLEPDRLRAALLRHRLELRIGALLVELGVLRADALEAALMLQAEAEEPGRKLGEILVAHGFLGAQQLAEVLASQLGVPCVAPGPLEPEPPLLECISIEACREHRFLPLRREGDRTVVAFADPLDKAAAAAAQALLGGDVTPRVATLPALEEAFARLDLATRAASESGAEEAAGRVLDEMIDAALRMGARHVHVEPSGRRLTVRFRRNGVLSTWRDLPPALGTALVRRLSCAAGAELDAGGVARHGEMRWERGGREASLGVRFLRTPGGECVTLRLPHPPSEGLALGALGLLAPMRARLEERALGAPGGVLLVAGPAGSGRSTTRAACAERLVSRESRLVQCEPGAGTLVPEWMEAALLQDPDAIAPGTLAASADLAAAIRAATGGPFVLGVLEAEGAVPALLAAAAAASAHGLVLPGVLGALGQRLVRRLCEACAEPAAPPTPVLRRLGLGPVDVAGGDFRRGRGCGRCGETGYHGRLGLFELDLLDEDGREHLRAAGDAAVLRRAAARCGPATLLEDGLVKAARGRTTLEELVRVVPRGARPRPLAEIERALGEERG